MARWILDTNIYVYMITGHPGCVDRVRAKLVAVKQGNHTLYLPVAVVAEVLYVLEGEHFKYSPEEASRALEQVIVSQGVECQDGAAVLYGLEMHREKNLDFVVAYSAGLAKESDILLITNDQQLAKRTDANVTGI